MVLSVHRIQSAVLILHPCRLRSSRVILADTMAGTSGGSNILRGGKRTFDCKTLVGNFVEEAYRPNAIKTQWSGGPMYGTTTKCLMQNGASVKQFGAGLKKDDDPRYDYHQIVGADKTRGSSTWVSLAHSAHNNSSQPTEFAAPRELKGHRMPEEGLKKHRQRWSHESEEMCAMRYVTEGTAATDKIVKPHFRKELTKPTQVTFK